MAGSVRRSRSRSRDERRHERRRHSRSRRSRSRSRDERRHERRRHSRSRRSRSGDEHRHERRRHSRSRRSRSGDGRRHSRNRRSRSRENRERTHPQQPHPCRAEDKKPKQSKTVDENPKQIKTDERQLGLRQTKEKQPSPRHTEEEQPHQGPEKPLKGLSSSKVTQRTLSPICEISAAASVKEPNQREKRQRQPFADFKPRLISSRTRSGSKEIDSVDPTSPSRSRSRSFDPFICDVNDIGNVDENPESDKTKATEKTTHHSASYRVLKENLLDNPGTQGSNPFSEVSESPSIQDFDCDADDPQPLDIEVSNSGEPTSFTKFKESLSKAGKKLKKPETSNVPDEVIAISDEELPKESLAKTPSKSQRVTKLSLRSSNKSKGTRGLLKPELERLVKDQEDTIQRLTQELEAQRNTEYLSSRPNRNLKEMTTVQQDIKRQELVYALDASGLALDSTLQANILKDLITKPMEGGWASLHGLEDTKRVIQETVVWPLLRPDIFQGPRRPPKGIMLFGPPGTGKTMIARLIAAECGMAYFFSVSAATITSKWVGECEKTVRALFDIARVAEHCVIFLDEMESLLSTRSDKGHDSSSKIKTEFLIQLNNIMEDGSNILFIGATNKPHMIDDAVRRRLGKRLYVPLPDATARTHMLKNLLSKVDQVDLSEADFDALAAQTNHFSGADLKTLVADSLNGPLRSLPAGTDIKSVQVKDIRPVSMLDFKESLLRIKPSVNLKDVAEHVQFNKAYGCS